MGVELRKAAFPLTGSTMIPPVSPLQARSSCGFSFNYQAYGGKQASTGKLGRLKFKQAG